MCTALVPRAGAGAGAKGAPQRHAKKAVAVFYHRAAGLRLLFVRHTSGDLALPGGSRQGCDWHGQGKDMFARAAQREALEEVAALAGERAAAARQDAALQGLLDVLRLEGQCVLKEELEFVTRDALRTTHHVYLVDITRTLRARFGTEAALQAALDRAHAAAPLCAERETTGAQFLGLERALCLARDPDGATELYHVSAEVVRRLGGVWESLLAEGDGEGAGEWQRAGARARNHARARPRAVPPPRRPPS